jgi:hypothetical protein
LTELITATEAGKRLGGITYGSLAKWRCQKSKALPFVKIGRKVYYRVSDIEAFIASNVNPGDGPKIKARRKSSIAS